MHVVLKEARVLQTILDLFLDLLLFIVFWELSMFPNESSLKMQFDYFHSLGNCCKFLKQHNKGCLVWYKISQLLTHQSLLITMITGIYISRSCFKPLGNIKILLIFGTFHRSFFYEQMSTNCSLWPGDVICRQWTGSTLAQVTACCLTARSHYLNEWWLTRRSSDNHMTAI